MLNYKVVNTSILPTMWYVMYIICYVVYLLVNDNCKEKWAPNLEDEHDWLAGVGMI